MGDPVSIITPYLPTLRGIQSRLMTDAMDVARNGTMVYTEVPCRATSNRLFAEPADPHDANMRSMAEWGVTYPTSYDVQVGDHLTIATDLMTIAVIVGEVVQGDTWQTAGRAWGNRPKLATPQIAVVLYRYDVDADTWTALPSQDVNLVYNRNQPISTPSRFSPGGASSYQGGWIVGDLDLDVQVEDRFTIDGLGAIITEILPHQPQHCEARFVMDVTGVR